MTHVSMPSMLTMPQMTFSQNPPQVGATPPTSVMRIRIQRIRFISLDLYQKLGWMRNLDPYQMIRIRIQQKLLKRGYKFIFLTYFKWLFIEKGSESDPYLFCLEPDPYRFCLDPDQYQSSVWVRIRNEFLYPGAGSVSTWCGSATRHTTHPQHPYQP